jgi:hypothetical protein
MPHPLQHLGRLAARGRPVAAVAATGGLVAALAAPVAAQASPMNGGVRNPGHNSTSDYRFETQIIGDIGQNAGGHGAGTGGYVTRQSNKSSTGGGAIYGCRARTGALACVAANNLANGDAFRFQADPAAPEIGLLRFGLDINKPVTKPPFATNGTGMVKNLNAERVGGLAKTDIVDKGSLLFAQVNETGAIAANRGVPAGGKAELTTPGDDRAFTVPFSGDISQCAVTATPSAAPGAAGERPSMIASVSADKTHAVITELGDGGGPDPAYGFHVQVVC